MVMVELVDVIIIIKGHCATHLKVMGTHVYLEIAVTRLMQPMPIFTPPSTNLFLGSNPFRPIHIL